MLPPLSPTRSRAHDVVLCEHLDHEEDLVIPALLELSPREFEEYRTLGVDELIQRLDATG